LRGVLDLLRGLRILADLETERLDSMMAPVDMLGLIRSLVEDHLDAAEQRGHSLQAVLPESLPSVLGVDRLIREALANYLTNAIKYTDRGGAITVRAEQAGQGVRVEVRDNGPGIATEAQDRLFQEFTKVGKPGSGSGEVAGIGLGLSIVRRIAEAHGGRFGVVSRPGQGSIFFIELPAIALAATR
jgi:signal transduction histidine kinase